jgi:hypothetical protein
MSALSTGPNIPLVTVGLYYLPSNEPKTTRHRALKERAYGTRDNDTNYPIGAQLLSNPSEYTIPSDRISYRKRDRAFKYFREMIGQYHIDTRFGKPNPAILSNAKRTAILRGLFAAWYVCHSKISKRKVFRNYFLRRDFAISSCVFDEGRCKSDWITS